MIHRRSPRLYAEAFVALLTETRPARHDSLLRAFVRLLARDRLVTRAEAVLREIDLLLLEREGFLSADVRLASRDEEDRVPVIEEFLGRLVGQPVKAAVTADPSLLAGFRAHVEDLVVDGSLRGVLSRLRVRLATP